MSTIQSPTVGRKLWFSPGERDPIAMRDQPLDATVCYVHNDRLVNLRVTDVNGDSFPRPLVTLVHDGDLYPVEGEPFCEWMPYQSKQFAASQEAAKAESQAGTQQDSAQLPLLPAEPEQPAPVLDVAATLQTHGAEPSSSEPSQT